ncbi:lipopolysaccharide heptosyltransferase II [Leptospira sp. GIMC2001]|uniref:lipopolysaccharide heptosyltransferase II n=1 Tax=Leptospira sp. GIMC2001 TaxID=1513297 RepID=UPI00234B45AA|nr:lipopolysaccharide heptosyltransferase II [Leptospira sp. GIMC2001]WCL47959.1 lipopolysaccharide heptosyltransferase II [Leptospira sp. GIMC2001]
MKQAYQNILIIQTAFLGDLILTTPFVHQVKKLYPNSKITIVVNQGTASVLEGNPDLDQILQLDKKRAKKSVSYFVRFAYELRKKKFDLVLSPHFSFRSSLLSWLTKAKVRIGYKQAGFSFLYTKKVNRPLQGMHEVDKLFSLIYDNTIEFPKGRERRPYLYPKSEDINFVNSLLSKDIQDFILISPSSLWETKRYPSSGFIELSKIILERTNLAIVLSGSPSDLELTNSIYESVIESKPKWKERLLNLACKTNLIQLAGLISKSKIIVSNDSSPIHYASAFNIPTLMIYGATIPEFGYSTLVENQEIAEITGLDCRPCGIHGGRICPEKHFRCMLDQDPKTLFSKIENILNRIYNKSEKL